MIAIIGAMKEEVAAVKDYVKIFTIKEMIGYTYIVGKIDDIDVVLVQSGIGKVNAAISTTLLLKEFDIDYVINVGTAGGLKKEQNVLDVVVSTNVIHHDVDVRVFNYEYGQVPGLPKTYQSSPVLLEKTLEILTELKVDVHVGTIVSGDQFISKEKQVDQIIKHFPDTLCADMEAASIAQVCYQFKVPFIITRSLSDIFGKGDNHIQFDEYLSKASISSARMCYLLAKSI